MDLWPEIVAARRSLIDTLADLDDEQWGSPSLCGAWTVREVLGHLILAAKPPAWRYVRAVARARGDFDTANHDLAVAEATRPTDQLLADYETLVEHRFSPPGWPKAAPLSDICLHSLDVRIPLGFDDPTPTTSYEPVLGLLFSRFGRNFAPSGRPEVRWVATDHDWSGGGGPEVRGAIGDLALTASGRPARLDRLDGDGVAAVAAWLG